MRYGSVVIGFAVVACSKPPPSQNASMSSPAAGSPSAPAPEPIQPPTAAPLMLPEDHDAVATSMYDGTNYVTPIFTYSRKRKILVYPACSGGEGPGERCALAGLDHAGKDVPIKPHVQWSKTAQHDVAGRHVAIQELTAALDSLDTVNLGRTPWRAGMDVAGFGRIDWQPDAKTIVATADGRTKQVPIQWSGGGGPVNVYAAAAVPVAVVQFRVNAANNQTESAKPKTEGYVVFIELAVVPRP